MEINEREELYSNYIRQMEKIEFMKENNQEISKELEFFLKTNHQNNT